MPQVKHAAINKDCCFPFFGYNIWRVTMHCVNWCHMLAAWEPSIDQCCDLMMCTIKVDFGPPLLPQEAFCLSWCWWALSNICHHSTIMLNSKDWSDWFAANHWNCHNKSMSNWSAMCFMAMKRFLSTWIFSVINDKCFSVFSDRMVKHQCRWGQSSCIEWLCLESTTQIAISQKCGTEHVVDMHACQAQIWKIKINILETSVCEHAT